MEERERTLFKTPFSRHYWGLAAKEFKSLRMLCIAAMLTALRIAVKALSIPVPGIPNLNITFGFLVNSVGSMIYGPLVAIAASAVSDTLGAILFPQGAYFFPFIFVEIAGGLIFALFYYRAKMTAFRIILGRFAVTAVCNLILNPIIMYYYYELVLGKAYTLYTLPRVIKNLVLFPAESVVLVILFNALIPVTNHFKLTYTGKTKIQFTKRDIIILIIMTIIAALSIVGYLWYKKQQ